MNTLDPDNSVTAVPRQDSVSRLLSQFSGPHGWLGHVAGWLMASKNRPTNSWIIELLGVGPEDRVLEIGFGPGIAIELAATRAARGLVAGIDRSDVMLRQARRRNRAAVKQGRVDLRLGSAGELPWPAGHFTRACATNSLQFWPSTETALREIHRVLAPGGRLVLGQRMRRETTNRLDRSRYGMSESRLNEIVATLTALGFDSVAIQRREISGETIAAIIAQR